MNSEIDFVAPDRYRMAMQGLGTQVIIGDTMYMERPRQDHEGADAGRHADAVARSARSWPTTKRP